MHIVAGPGFFGISDLIKLAALAETFHMDMEPHDFGGGTASLHALLALPNARYYELAVPRGWLHEVLYPGLYIDQLWIDSEGCVHAPTKPGLGFDLDPDAAKRYTVDTLRA